MKKTGKAALIACLCLSAAAAVYDGCASAEDFQLDLDYILSYDQQQCSDMIFFGDSRVVGMSQEAGGYHYVGKVAAGYAWMSGEGSSLLQDMMNQWPQADIVFCFGINDLGNIDSYISWFESFSAQYPDRRCWYLSVNPVSELSAARSGYTVRNDAIDAFNSRLEEAFQDRYLDTWSYFMEYGVSSADGVHYSGNTYAALEDCTWRAISEKLEEENAKAADGN